MGPDEATPVRAFYVRARAFAGSEERLAEVCEELDGPHTYSRQAVNAWINGVNDPPTRLTFRLAQHYRISLDELLLSDEDRRTLQDQVRELREREAIIVSYVNRLLQSRGERPIDFGSEATAS